MKETVPKMLTLWINLYEVLEETKSTYGDRNVELGRRRFSTTCMRSFCRRQSALSLIWPGSYMVHELPKL